MSRWTPCKRREFIRRLRKLGFDGPFSGTRHQFLVYQKQRLAVPTNPEYSVAQLRMMVREVEEMLGREITAEEWDGLYGYATRGHADLSGARRRRAQRR